VFRTLNCSPLCFFCFLWNCVKRGHLCVAPVPASLMSWNIKLVEPLAETNMKPCVTFLMSFCTAWVYSDSYWVNTHIYICVCVCVCVCVCARARIYIDTHTYSFTYSNNYQIYLSLKFSIRILSLNFFMLHARHRPSRKHLDTLSIMSRVHSVYTPRNLLYSA
jgi:hypothetical protein